MFIKGFRDFKLFFSLKTISYICNVTVLEGIPGTIRNNYQPPAQQSRATIAKTQAADMIIECLFC